MANKLRSAITNSDTTITLEFSENFTQSGYVQIGSEIIHYSYSGDIYLFNCTRGALGTSAASHSAAIAVSQYVPTVPEQTLSNGITLAIDATHLVYTSADGLQSATITLA